MILDAISSYKDVLKARAEEDKKRAQWDKDNPHYADLPFESKNMGLTSKAEEIESLKEKWSAKYKRSIDCNNPKGFSQKAHCQGRKKND